MDYDELEQVLGAYYHEDADGMWPPFDDYVADATAVDLGALVRDIDLLLASTPPADLPEETWRLGSYLFLGNEPQPYIAWLTEMRRRARAATRTSAAG